jgi:ATP-dependent exoDNAse (exonuclease V) alpha subunit
VAIFRLQITSIGRNAGRRATSAAAYRAGERIRDERSGDIHNFSRRKDVAHKEILLPSSMSGAQLDWARDRSALWNAVERAETRRTARVAREFQVNLPSELAPSQRQMLARAFSQELADRYKVAIDLAIHEPRAGGDARNYHAHLLATTREITPDGLGSKAGLDMSADERQRRGLLGYSQEYTAVRERWATLTNEALREAHIDARIDHRSLRAQGIDREPTRRIPHAAILAERAAKQSEIADKLRAQHNERVQARADLTARHDPNKTVAVAAPAKTLEQIKEEAARAWWEMRFGGAQAADASQDRIPSRDESRSRPRASALEDDKRHTAQLPDHDLGH